MACSDAKARKKQIDYWHLGGERWWCNGCREVILGGKHTPRNHIENQHDASPHIIRMAAPAQRGASDKPVRILNVYDVAEEGCTLDRQVAKGRLFH